MKTRKPMLTTDQLVEYMKDKGVRFNIVGEEQARRQLRENNDYFKLTSFSDNYSRYTSGPNAGKYERLEYAYLQELAQIDLEVRHLLLDMALDVEHSLKTALIAAVEKRMLAGEEDGYRIIREFLLDAGNPSLVNQLEAIDRRAGNLAKKIKQNRKNPYCDVLIETYSDEMPVWAYVELVTFGELQELAEYYQQRTGWKPPVDLRSVDRVRQIRNACAHGNCVINDLRPMEKPANSSAAPRHITDFLSAAGIKANMREKKMSNQRISQIVHTLYVFDQLVRDPYMRKLRMDALDQLLNVRMQKNRRYFADNELLTSSYAFFCRLVGAMRRG